MKFCEILYLVFRLRETTDLENRFGYYTVNSKINLFSSYTQSSVFVLRASACQSFEALVQLKIINGFELDGSY